MAVVLFQPFPMAGAARAQIWRHQWCYHRPRHFHAEPELNLITSGTGTFGVGDAELPIRAGDLLFFQPGQDHELVAASPDFYLFALALEPALSGQVLGPASAAALAGPLCTHLPRPTFAGLEALCADAADERLLDGEQRVCRIWREAHDARTSGRGMHVVTRRAFAPLLERPTRRRSELAAFARSHPAELSRRFHADVGLSLGEYRARVRMLRFIEAVDRGAGSMLGAARAAGFGSYSQCHRVFQKTLGCSPRAFFGGVVRRRMEDLYAPWTEGAHGPPYSSTTTS